MEGHKHWIFVIKQNTNIKMKNMIDEEYMKNIKHEEYEKYKDIKYENFRNVIKNVCNEN